jgi:hypothetical protein
MWQSLPSPLVLGLSDSGGMLRTTEEEDAAAATTVASGGSGCTKPTECAFFHFCESARIIIFANLRVFGAKKEKMRRNADTTHA